MSRGLSIDEFMEICLDIILERYRLGDIRSESSRKARKKSGDRGYRERNGRGKFKRDSRVYELPD